MSRTLGGTLALAALALLGAATLFPHPGDSYQAALTPFWCLACGELGTVDVLLNLLLFVPFGSGLRWAGLTRRRSLALVALTTLLIEGLQYRLIAGRDASLSDLLTNTLGGWIGILLADHWRWAIFPPALQSRRLGRMGAIAWPLLWLLCGWSLGLALPRTTWWGQWAPELGQFEHFSGTVLEARLGGIDLPPRRLDRSREIRDRLLADRVRLEATVVTSGLTTDLAPIVSIFDEHQTEVLLLGQNGTDLVFRVRRRVSGGELRNPAVRLLGAFGQGGAGSDTVRLVAEVDHQRMFLALTRPDGTSIHREATLSPSWGWSFLIPYEYALGPEDHWLSALWVAGLIIPLAYWSVRGVRREPAGPWGREAAGLAPLAVGVTLGLGLVPWLVGLLRVHWSEWAAAAAGGTLGWWLGRQSRGRLRDR